MYPVYKMHRRINAPIEFHGLKAQYILYAGGMVVADMTLFALLYLIGVNNYVCLLLCFAIGGLGIGACFHLSHRYGQYGWLKRRMAKSMPGALRPQGRRIYLRLKK
jgi:hypothetical protein